ncbi:hypothetical protein PP707_04000 [Acetobacter pasteurianus]|nr:hypothetical protein [Acetobacter pasteurianus]
MGDKEEKSKMRRRRKKEKGGRKEEGRRKEEGGEIETVVFCETLNIKMERIKQWLIELISTD